MAEHETIPAPMYASFLVRLWREPGAAPGAPPSGWQGEAEHIQSGERWTFGSLEELLGFLRQQTGHSGGTGDPPVGR